MKIQYKSKGLNMFLFAGFLFILSILSACEKMVDAGDPLTTITTNQTFSRDGSAYSALAGIYSLLLNGTQNKMTFSNGGLTLYPGMSSDELINNVGIASKGDYDFVVNAVESNNNAVRDYFWQPMYNVVYNVNSLIEGVQLSTSNQLTPGARKQLTAEAKFIRAFCYFYLVNLYGDVPLVLSTDWKTNTQLKRAPQDEVYKQIIQDLLDAQKDLPEDYSSSGGERIRANKYVATSLLSRVYLYRKDWHNAELQASSVIGNSQFAILDDLQSVFLANSKETIWQLKPSAANTQTGIYDTKSFLPEMYWTNLSDAERPVYLLYFSEVSVLFYPPYLMTSDLSASFEQGDQRKVAWTSYIETPDYAPYTGVSDFFPKKYDEVLNTTDPKKFYTVFRLAEQVLIRAEARANLDNLAGADEDLNTIRKRAGLANLTSGSKSAALDAVAHERRVELFAEWGHRWFDLKRTGKALEVLGKNPVKKLNTNGLLYPIPLNEIGSDPNIIQNPGY